MPKKSTAKSLPKNTTKWNPLAVVGFITAFVPVWSLAAPIMGVIALSQIKRTKERGKGLAIASIVLPIIFLIAVVSLVVVLILAAERNTQAEASKYGLTKTSYNQLKSAVDGSCQLANLSLGNTDTDGRPYGADNITIERIEGDFARGKRKCYEQVGSDTFIAEKTGQWKIIFTGENPDCDLVTARQIPSTIAPNCVDDFGTVIENPVQSLSLL
jgi:hypothetical protein